MDNIFGYDNKFFEVLGKITDIVILNFLCIFSSIPIITIGASLTATYSVAMQMVKDEETYIVKSFIKKFKDDFKISTIAWMLIMMVGVALAVDFQISNFISSEALKLVLQFIFTMMSIIVLFIFTYTFSIISKFKNTIKNTLRNSIIISIQNLPYTIIMVLINLSPIIMIFLFNSYWGYIVFFYTVIGYGAISYINSIFLNKILEKYRI